jgi:putative ABC transport system ATP-binding protein
VVVTTHRRESGHAAVPAILLDDVIRIYRDGAVETIALRGVDASISRGEYVALMGRSGSGKSTLLHLIAGLDSPSGGRVTIDGVDVSHAGEATRLAARRGRVGIVFQSDNLPPFVTLDEGVALACALAGTSADSSTRRTALASAGLEERRHHRPGRLSGGEQQRAAVATVLATRPSILLADEITGELDSTNASRVLDLLDAARSDNELTLVLATHDPDVARRADRVIELRDGRVVGDSMGR